MWLIRKVTSNLPYYLGFGQFVYVVENSVSFRGAYIDMENTETGERARHHLEPSEDSLSELLELYNPYGYVNIQIDSKGPNLGHLFHVVDELSFQFLDCVKSVDVIHLPVISEIYKQCNGRGKGYERVPYNAIDDMKSFFVCNFPDGRNPYFATLYQLLCYIEDGWVGDEFYIFGGYKLMREFGGSVGQFYRVQFTNVHQAKRLIMNSVLNNDVAVINYLRQTKQFMAR